MNKMGGQRERARETGRWMEKNMKFFFVFFAPPTSSFSLSLSHARPSSLCLIFSPPPLSSHSHSIVAGGLEEMSYTTRLTARTSLQILVDTWRKKAGSKGYQSAVMPSPDVTARKATTCECVRWSPWTPTERMGKNTAKACQILSYKPAARISLMKTSSTARRVARASPAVTSPMTRTARPGPGKGWRAMKVSGTFRAGRRPRARTSS